jgi:FlaA1/EpsC-like NDP-sugar epimerase
MTPVLKPVMTPALKPAIGPALVFSVLGEAGMVIAAGLSAFLLRFEFDIPAYYLRYLPLALGCWLVVKLTVFHFYDLDRSSYRFFSADDALRLARANAVGSVLSTVLLYLIVGSSFPRAILILDLLLCSLITGAGFLAGRLTLQSVSRSHGGPGREILIYGAGQAGVSLLAELRGNRKLGYRVCGFIDDDPALAGIYVQGIKVLGRGSDLKAVCARTGATEVLIAAPSASGGKMLRILQHCQHAQVRYRTVAALGEIIEGKAIASQIREVDVQDLLCRTPVHLDHFLIRERMEGKVVMITGAAGSIGSELCRQIARFQPAALIAFEIAETPLFHLDREMRAQFPEVPFFAEIGSIQNPRRLASVLETHRPDVIYHAAAYKHVPLMEASLLDAIENNVFGTYNVLTAAEDCGVDEFVFISSDKAVRPSSIMGATKRLCELLVLSQPSANTRRMAVRFGNVLGSNGSVIPLFKQQIATGGPVTITHPDMRRYFMTIPEATQLVLQASAMGDGGEIFVLDMGEQVRIVDLAQKLIQLSGLAPDVDIKIVYTGTRPGEKLYEELCFDDEVHLSTTHPKIKRFAGNGLTASSMLSQIRKLMKLCQAGDEAGAMRLLLELVPEYRPAKRILPFPAPEHAAPLLLPTPRPAEIRA